jgi:hypothetical protein
MSSRSKDFEYKSASLSDIPITYSEVLLLNIREKNRWDLQQPV